MEGDHFSLCWNNFHANLSSGFHSLLKEGELVDVTLAAEGKFIKAHKAVLSVCSPFFKELFRVNPCKHPIVILPDVNYESLRSLMQFMYQGEVSVSQEEISTFMRVAEVLKVKGLTDNSDAANGFTNPTNRSSLGLSELKQNLLKRPRYVKKFTRPLNPWRPIDGQKLQKSPPPQSLSSHPSPVPSPGPKKPRLDSETSPPVVKSPPPMVKSPPPEASTSQSAWRSTPSSVGSNKETLQSSSTERPPSQSSSQHPILIKPKDEPIDHSEEETSSQCGMDEMNMDIANMLDTTLGDSAMQFPGWPTPEMAKAMMQQQDSSSPGTSQAMFLKSGRGQVVLINNGHIYTNHSRNLNYGLWVCVKQKKLNCSGCVWTLHPGPVVLNFMRHNHSELTEDIKRLQITSSCISPELRL